MTDSDNLHDQVHAEAMHDWLAQREPPDRPDEEGFGLCRECGCDLTHQEGSMCSPCYHRLTESHD